MTDGRQRSRELDPARLALGAVAAAAAFAFSLTKIYDNDVWWHLATGRWMVASGRVPTADPFSFTTSGAPWVAHSWLAELVMYAAERVGGLDGIILLKATIVGAAFALSYRYAVRAGVAPWLASGALLLAIPLAYLQFRERPAVAMFLLDAVFFWRLAMPGAETSRRTWIVLLPLMWVWVNVHGSFFLGVVFAGCLLAERGFQLAVARARGLPGPDRRSLLAAIGLVGALAALSVASPYGFALPRQMVGDFTALAVSRSFDIVEHRPFEWAAHLGHSAFVAATLASFLVAWRSARVYLLAVFLCVNELARRSQRFSGIAAVIDAGILAVNLAPAAAALAGRLRWRPAVAMPAFALAAAATLTLGWRASFTEWGEAQPGFGVNAARFPVGATDFLARAGIEGNLVNSWAFGGYLLWRLPAIRDFIDGRTLPAQIELLDGLYKLDADTVERWLMKQGVRGAVVLHADPFAQLFGSSRFFEVGFVDDKAIVYLPVGHPAAAARRYRTIRLGPMESGRIAALAKGPSAAAAEAELRAAVAETLGSATQRLVLAEFLEQRGNPEAVDHYVAAARQNPRLFFAGVEQPLRAGRLAIARGDRGLAAWLATRALEIHGGDAELLSLLGAARGAPP